jgi:hypothetical protein
LNGTITNFKLERCSLFVLTNAYIFVKITNSTGISTTLAPTPFWVDQIEIFNAQGNALSSITGQQLFLTLAFLSRNEFEQLASYMYLSTAYATMELWVLLWQMPRWESFTFLVSFIWLY